VAARGESISFNQLHNCEHKSRVKQVLFCQAENKIVPREELIKGFEHSKGQYVVIDEEDIKKVRPKTAGAMEILEFVKANTVDPVYLESSYYVAPGVNGAKPYALLFEGMKAAGYFAVAKVTMHSREHVVVIRPAASGLVLHTMFYRHEVREVDEFRSDASLLNEKELKLAGMLIESLAADFEPLKYTDNYRTNLQAMIQAKVEGREVTEIPVAAQGAQVINIMDALERSLQQKTDKKTAAVEKALAAVVEAAPKKRKKTA
jgi:DNA end-binding protein Ku